MGQQRSRKIHFAFIEILKSGHLEGKPTNEKDVKIYVISKQTTLVYKLNNSQKRIETNSFLEQS